MRQRYVNLDLLLDHINNQEETKTNFFIPYDGPQYMTVETMITYLEKIHDDVEVYVKTYEKPWRKTDEEHTKSIRISRVDDDKEYGLTVHINDLDNAINKDVLNVKTLREKLNDYCEKHAEGYSEHATLVDHKNEYDHWINYCAYELNHENFEPQVTLYVKTFKTEIEYID